MADTKEIQFKIRQLGNKLLEQKVSAMLCDVMIDYLQKRREDKTVDCDAHARKIISYLREHLVHSYE